MNSSVQKTMKTFFWLVRREFWANKGLFFWAPTAIASALFLFFVCGELKLSNIFSPSYLNSLQNKEGDLAVIKYVTTQVNRELFAFSHLFIYALMVLGAFLSSVYMLGALHDDRRDRSIFFWKSLPISDHLEVAAKLFLPLVLAPLLNLTIAVVSFSLATLVVAIYSLFGPINLFITFMSNVDLYEYAIGHFLILPYYLLWSLPTVAWFLMVSAWSKSRVVPWAIGLPLLGVFVSALFNTFLKLNLDISWIFNQVVTRLIAANIPASWVINREVTNGLAHGVKPWSGYFSLERIFNVEWTNPSLWIGVAAGLVMIMLTIRLRKNAGELSY